MQFHAFQVLICWTHGMPTNEVRAASIEARYFQEWRWVHTHNIKNPTNERSLRMTCQNCFRQLTSHHPHHTITMAPLKQLPLMLLPFRAAAYYQLCQG